MPIFLQITKNVERNAKVKISYRLFTAENFKSYKSELKSLGINDYFVSDDVDSFHKIFCEHIVKIINKCFPIKQKYIRQKTLNNKWLTHELLCNIKIKNRLFAKKLKHPTSKNIEKYHQQLKIVEKSKKYAKRSYFKEELSKYNNNVKKKWGVLREIILRKKKVDNINFINQGDKLITDKTTISHIFADHFQNVGSSLAKQFQGISKRKFERWLYRSPRPPEIFNFQEVNPHDVDNIISSIDIRGRI